LLPPLAKNPRQLPIANYEFPMLRIASDHARHDGSLSSLARPLSRARDEKEKKTKKI
jgi:hypothetical protein